MSSHPRRYSLESTLSKPRPSFGKPLQIYSELVNTGKNLQGTKKRIRWKFGWTESDTEHEVELIHSLVSGKKNYQTIIEDGTEITTASALFSSDFSYGWNSINCNHVFRIEANLGIASDHSYVFSIDGVNYMDFPRKQAPPSSQYGFNHKPSSSPTKENGFGTVSDQTLKHDIPSRRSSTGSNFTIDRQAFQSPSQNSNQQSGFDPFNARDSTPADPFASSTDPFTESPEKSNRPASTRLSTPVKTETKPKEPSKPVDLLDFSSGEEVASTTKTPQFDPFSASSAQFSGFDAFESPHKSLVSFNEVTSTSASTNASTAGTGFSDPFASSMPLQSTANSSPTRRQSVQDIINDLGDLSISSSTTSTTPASVFNLSESASTRQSSSAALNLFPAVSSESSTTTSSTVSSVSANNKSSSTITPSTSARNTTLVDPWASPVVNLNISNDMKTRLDSNSTLDSNIRRSSVNVTPSKPLDPFDNLNWTAVKK